MKKLSTLFITLLAVVSLFAQERILQIGDVEIPIESNIEYQFVPENNSVKLMIDKVEEHSFPMPVNIEFVTNYTISVTGVSLSSSTLTLIQGSDATLIATITPPDATNKNLEWTSSNKSVATVTNNGKIITLGVGETIITVTTVDGEFKASCVITVNPPKVPVSGIVLSHTTLHLNRGDVETIEATITPPDASNQAVQWKSADESVATVSNAGKVTAVGAGATTIIATTDDGGKTAQCNVTVKIPVTSISIVQTDAEIAVGKSYQLDVDISPENATNQTIVWESSDESVATVNHNGKVTALTVGSTTITATVEGEDKSSTSTITVYQPDVLVTNVSLNVHEVHVSVGDESKLIATILPPNATNKTLAWSSSDEAIATVDAEGNVEAIASGEAYIKVLAADGTYADSCKFVVSTIAVAVEGVSLSSKTLALSVGKSISIEATVTPSNATNKDVIWSSTDNSVATVDATGKITAVGAGQAIITATTVNNAKTASCTVTVRVPVTGIAITNVTDSIEKGKTHQFEVEFSPENATNKTITWKSLDESVATITQYGKVTAVATGTVTITVTTEDGNHIATHEVTVFEPDVEVLGVVLNTHSVELSEGSNTSLIAMVSPPNASNTAVVWTSADKSIAVVDSQGKISALKEGETYIKVTTEDGNYSDSCLLVVNTIAVPVEEVQVSDKIMYVRVNEAATITATVLPEFASNKSVVWSSSDETIASITDDGEITAYKEGEVLLIVIAQDGGHADSCTLIVNNEFIMHNAFVYIPVVNPATGKTWLDRNLGASQVATSSTDERAYGDLYQWGRQADGHEKRNSNIAAVLSDSDTPDHDKFIIVNATPNDWRTPQNNALWQGPEHKNNPCPAGYKVPTQVEWQEELDSWDSENDMGAFGSILKLPMAGYRSNTSGEVSATEAAGRYWASTIVGTSAHRLYVVDGQVSATSSFSRGIGYSVRCIKDESIYVGSVSLDKTTANIEKTDSLQLTATVLPANATNKNLSWSSSDESVATVDNTGKVSALQVGTTIITATTEDGGYTAECEVTVFVVGVESIEISHTTLELEKGEKDTLRVIILPENAYNKTVTWESLDESVATVDDNGNVTAISVGTTTITAITEDGGHTAECELTVVNITVKGIDISPKSIEIGVNNTKTLQFTVLPEDAFNKTVIWSSYDESIATVDDNGNVTAISVGDATITATSEDGGHADSCKVTVIPSSGTFIDERDNTEYKWVLIGEQVWMAENLAYLPQVNHPIDEGSATEPMYYVYDYYGTNVEDAKATDNYKTYGVLYNPTAAQDACPNGWYVPERNDFDMLTDFIGKTEHGGKLKAVGTEFWQAPNEGATDEYGFNALPGGRFYYGLSNPFSGLGESAIWRYGSGSGNLLYNLYYNNTNILYSNSNWAYAPSIRCIKADGTSVESVSLSAASKEIVVHESFVLTATITPSRVVNRTIAWSSSDETVATVDALGTVTGISEGVATIIVTTEDGGHTDSCEVTVRFVSVESVDISDAILEIGKGTTLQLTATVLPANATNKNLSWSSSDESVATVDADGIITALQVGTTTITATTEDGGYTAECEVTVFIISVESIEISDATLELEKGATKQLTVTVLPADATNKTIIWESSDESIATVDENGNVTAISAGNVTITATIEDGGYTAECAITVFISVESIEISDATLEIGKGTTLQLIATVLPANATNKNLSWSSSDESIVTVDADGLITAIEVGSATIIVQSDNGIIDSCEFTVLTELIIHDGFNYGVVTNPATGQTWLDRNLGASRVATSIDDELSFGDLYQWGRGTDGHEKRNSATTSTLSDNDTPGHGDFITTNSASNDWRSSQNDNLWQGVDSINNPCPDGYRIPTKAEFDNELKSRSINNFEDAFNSPLKMSKAGFRFFNGNFNSSSSCFWSSDVGGTSVYSVYISDSDFAISTSPRATGNSVRCIRHEEPATSVSLDKATVEVEVTKTVQLIANVLPTDAFNKNVMWSSADETVATVDNEGIITALKIGSITITATTVDGGFEDSCVVTVIPHTGTFIDERDSTEYKWVQIGEQVWMAENMRYLPQVNNISESSETEARYYVYDYDGNNLDDATATDEYITYGTLYNWEAALQACPEGWHLPNNAEWEELVNFAGGGSTASERLKSATAWSVNNMNGTDEYGFAALPAGEIEAGAFYYLHRYASFWLSEESSTSQAYYPFLGGNNEGAPILTYNKTAGTSVRCLKD